MEKHPNETLIVVTGDHETGGMTMGFAGTGYALYMERLIYQKCSAAAFTRKIIELKKANPKLQFDDVKKDLSESFGFKFTGDVKKDPMVLTDAEQTVLKKAFASPKPKNFVLEARRILNNKAGVGWTSGAHTGLPVLTTSKGVKAEIFTGFINNTDIAIKMKSLF